jgi:flagellar secretion chaperone FliS
MSYQSNAKKFQRTSIMTASREQLLLMLYEGAIKSVKLAVKSIEEKNIPEKCKQISKAHDIVLELSNTIDRKVNPELADRLEGLYEYCGTQLLQANMENNPQHLENVLKILTKLYEGWVAAVGEYKKQQSGESKK